mgnify:CR=1 FL=1
MIEIIEKTGRLGVKYAYQEYAIEDFLDRVRTNGISRTPIGFIIPFPRYTEAVKVAENIEAIFKSRSNGGRRRET